MRKFKSILFGLLGYALLAAFFIPILNLLTVLYEKGKSALNLRLITEMTPAPGITGGGLGNAIIGSLEMVGFALLLAVPIGIILGSSLSLHKHRKWAQVIQLINDTFLSLPSILYGLFVYLILVIIMGHFSALAGAVALALLAIPIVARGTEDLLFTLPSSLREAGFALGAPEGKVAGLLIRSVGKGLTGVVILTFARIFGETAPLLFTSLNSSYLNLNFLEPTASLPVTLYNFAMSPDANWQAISSAGALFMIIIVFMLSLLARSLILKRKQP